MHAPPTVPPRPEREVLGPWEGPWTYTPRIVPVTEIERRRRRDAAAKAARRRNRAAR